MHRLFFLLILLFTVNSYAVEVTNLVQAASPVASKSDEERQKVAPDILRKVIIKLVGNRPLVAATDLSKILDHTDQYIQQYEYQRINSVSEDLTQPDKLQLVVTFKADLLRKAILDLGLPIWSQSRPEILVWLAVEEQGKRRLIGADDTSPWKQRIKQAADERGLPVLFPVMDLQEQRLVTFSDLSAGFTDTIEQASQRYEAPVILMIMAKVDDSGFAIINWSAKIGEQSEKWQSRSNKEVAIYEGMGQLADRLAKQLAQYQTFAQAYPIKLHISGVEHYADYVKLEKYLESLQYVSDVTVSRVVADTVDMTLYYSGNMDALSRLLSIDRVLIADTYSTTNELNYRLAP